MVEHRLNFVRMIHTNNVAAVEKSLIENESDSPLSISISNLEEMVGFTQEANLEDIALLTKAKMHLDHVESAVAIRHRAKQQHEQGEPLYMTQPIWEVVFRSTMSLKMSMQN